MALTLDFADKHVFVFGGTTGINFGIAGTFAGHGHYLNMTEPSYRGVACGITTLPSGQIWIVQDFYR